MTYSINPIPDRRRKKRAHDSGVLFFYLALLAFLVIGLTVSLSIRACLPPEGNQSVEPHPHEMPDSVVRICMPRPLEGIPEQIIRKISYIVSYNKDTKQPNWVAWQLTAEHTDGVYARLGGNAFHEDEEVAQPRATLEDYRGSGWSRGHMCPAGDNKWDADAMYESFLFTNVCPQDSRLNSGLWNSVEIDCRRWAKQFGDIYIVCGPVFFRQEHERIGENMIPVPEAFFKVVLCLNGKPKGLGIVVKNNAGTKKSDLYYNSIDQVERITGMDFFPELPDDLENAVESESDINEWN